MTTLPPVTLLVPCFNAESHLPRLLGSARAQSVPFSETLCYDDASTDATSSVARGLGATVIRGEQNRGPAHARNALWRATSAEWVHFHDADDLMKPDFLEKMSARISNEIDVVVCCAEWLFEDSRELEMRWDYREAPLRASPVNYLLGNPVGGINGLYRRSFLERIGGFDTRLPIWEDADLHVRLAAAGARFAVVEEPLVIGLRRRKSQSTPERLNCGSRLAALQNYARSFPGEYAPALVVEFDKAARSALACGDTKAARDAISLAASLGGRLPLTASTGLKLVRSILGPMAALRIQALARR